ncbi:MAG TPA: hypothetical protein DIS79_00815 [Bacteroidetes bacterium]|nr:hypothetical protein [Bacteroidota bacterium]HRK04488.1 glycosyltransferase [Chlorobiota bacterium]
MSDDPTGPIRLSVLIATRQRRDVLAMCLSNYEEQTFRDFEIIVVDNGSTDGTDEMVMRDFPHVRYVHLPENRGPEALNLAAQMAHGEFLWRTDDDAHPGSDDMFARLVEFLDTHPHLAVVAGEIFQATTQSFERIEPAWPNLQLVPAGGVETVGFSGCSVCFRTTAFHEAGGFWNSFYLEEEDLAVRLRLLGHRMWYLPSIYVVHYAQTTPSDMSARWALMTTQILRFQFKYYGMIRAILRSSIVVTSQLLMAVWHRIHPSFVYQTLQHAARICSQAYRSERIIMNGTTRKRVLNHDAILPQTIRYYVKALQRRRGRAVTDTQIHESSKNKEEHHGTH